ncbi:hypothetical protein MF271_17090 (plasmid) [Deinococcus sp. KNUC1210]|uniref:MHYT domain-containing protein n=1 Tax=Deinococcus sp. KNUC1210 TaxID=2917691 RepID=UPI001EF13504|nr:MHYT domain-containing protein [Deinococcus sp. KNUC1210]ULH17040.1 hypothetical protein MF271_17090 [Deinococcus sp. KNUC1210]
MDTMMIDHSWNIPYILLSIGIAVITSFFALELARRFRRTDSRMAPLILGTVLGYGIWAMHFVGMLAFELHSSFSYELPRTLISGVAAIIFLIAACFFWDGGSATPARIGGSGVIAGTGIVLMHYLGMSALQLNATTSYVPGAFIVSVLIAVGAATAAFYLFTRAMATQLATLPRIGLQIGAALVMGAAIAGMHYTGMAAIHFSPKNTASINVTSGSDSQGLVFLILGLTLVVFLLTFTFILADQMTKKPIGAASD